MAETQKTPITENNPTSQHWCMQHIFLITWRWNISSMAVCNG